MGEGRCTPHLRAIPYFNAHDLAREGPSLRPEYGVAAHPEGEIARGGKTGASDAGGVGTVSYPKAMGVGQKTTFYGEGLIRGQRLREEHPTLQAAITDAQFQSSSLVFADTQQEMVAAALGPTGDKVLFVGALARPDHGGTKGKTAGIIQAGRMRVRDMIRFSIKIGGVPTATRPQPKGE
jgi:hypothetical protein